jgi:hypothetical protein
MCPDRLSTGAVSRPRARRRRDTTTGRSALVRLDGEGVSLAGAVTSRRRQPGQLVATAAVSGGSSSSRCGSPRGSTVERLGVRARPCGVTDGGWLRSPRARSCGCMRESESLSTAPAAARAVTARPSAPSDVRRPATGVPHPWTGDTSVHVRRVDHGGAGAGTSVSADGCGPEPGALRPVRPSRSAAPLEPTSGGVMTASEGPVLLRGVQTVEEQLRRLEARLLAEARGPCRGGGRAAAPDARPRPVRLGEDPSVPAHADRAGRVPSARKTVSGVRRPDSGSASGHPARPHGFDGRPVSCPAMEPAPVQQRADRAVRACGDQGEQREGRSRGRWGRLPSSRRA